MKYSVYLCIAYVAIVAAMAGCKKSEGEGGKSSISGVIKANYYDRNSKLVSSELAPEERVYLVYGNNQSYDDKVDANADGSYSFKYLRDGNYHVFAYSECDTCAGGLKEVRVNVEISKKTDATAEDLVVDKILDLNDGTGRITGKILIKEYNAIGQLIDTYDGFDERVYIIYDSETASFDNNRSAADGSFQFDRLIPGNYTVYAVSDCAGCSGGTEIKSSEITIDSKGAAADAGTITIERRP